MKFSGVYTALVTPFTKDDRVDTKTLTDLVTMQIDNGITGLVPVGTTGESPALSADEHALVIETVVKAADGRVPVIAGCGSNSTAKAIAMTQRAHALGAAASLQVTPYYNKPNQQGLHGHFKAIADAVDMPVVLYNIPGRSAVALTTQTIVDLLQHPNISAIKDAAGNITQAMELLGQDLPPGSAVLSGDDSLAFPLAAIGGRGLISVAANVIPAAVAGMMDAALNGDIDKARTEHYRLLPLFRALFADTNPIPIKHALAYRGHIIENLRLPLCAADVRVSRIVEQALDACAPTG